MIDVDVKNGGSNRGVGQERFGKSDRNAGEGDGRKQTSARPIAKNLINCLIFHKNTNLYKYEIAYTCDM